MKWRRMWRSRKWRRRNWRTRRSIKRRKRRRIMMRMKTRRYGQAFVVGWFSFCFLRRRRRRKWRRRRMWRRRISVLSLKFSDCQLSFFLPSLRSYLLSFLPSFARDFSLYRNPKPDASMCRLRCARKFKLSINQRINICTRIYTAIGNV